MAKKLIQSKAQLLLEDGSLFSGLSFGATTTKIGECVFHTAHSGYQEILTDPSYQKQILVFSLPQIGNQGVSVEEDSESAEVWASGLVVRDYSEAPFHFRKTKSLSEVLEENDCPGISGVDTRRLILHLREKGNLWGALSTDGKSKEDLRALLAQNLSMTGLSLTDEVTTHLTYRWVEASKHLMKSFAQSSGSGLKRCVVMDFGVKRQILRYLIDSGFKEVIVVPAKTKASDILSLKPDGILLSNGPGDPAADLSIIEEVRKLVKTELPILGICLGHQILGLALDLKTYKLKFGHHGSNHPVKNLITKSVEISSHNHGFAVELDEKHPALQITYRNLNDQTIEGFRHRRLPIQAIQFHPESGPGPLDSIHVFREFQKGFQAA